jgi:hypothetical protein
MRTYGFEIHPPQRYCHEGAIPPQSQDSVTKLQCSLVLMFSLLVEINICNKGYVNGVKRRYDALYGNATP